MFVLITIATLVIFLTTGLSSSRYPIAAHDPGALMVFWPSSWLLWLLYALWVLALLNSLIFPAMRPYVLQYIGQIGAPGNMKLLNILLLLAAFLLACIGWVKGNITLFIPGVIVTVGLLGNGLEQRTLF